MTEEMKSNVALALTSALQNAIEEEVKKQVSIYLQDFLVELKNKLNETYDLCNEAQDERDSAYTSIDDLSSSRVCDLEDDIDYAKENIDSIESKIDDIISCLNEINDLINDLVIDNIEQSLDE